MSPKEKAQKLYGEYYQILMGNTNPKFRSSKVVKACALRAIVEIEKINETISTPNGNKLYWSNVKKELEIL